MYTPYTPKRQAEILLDSRFVFFGELLAVKKGG
jgi:hypothetical protein